jgi:hypothetical protein
MLVAAVYAMPQANTISAKPGAVNYIEGSAAINGKAIQGKPGGNAFLNANDTLTTSSGKAEVLLTPGVFVRLDANSELKMISPSLTLTQIELVRGNAMVEVAQLVKENDIQILDHGATIFLRKTGLYRLTADDSPVAQTLDGKAEVSIDGRSVKVAKGHEVALAANAKVEKVKDKPEHTDLYAWSKVRDEYDAAASYASARDVSVVPGGGWGWGWNGFYGAGLGPGWAWNPYWNTFAWLPGTGAFYSPFGFGFYAPSYIAYAPVVVTPVGGRRVTVPVNPTKPGTGTTAPVQHPTVPAGRSGAGGTGRPSGGFGGTGRAGGFSPGGHASNAPTGHR